MISIISHVTNATDVCTFNTDLLYTVSRGVSSWFVLQAEAEAFMHDVQGNTYQEEVCWPIRKRTFKKQN